ncbi:hypothetical protein GCM10009544_38590 [Streptomyces stramineus]|uniref:Uncharacterized protein n=1 Tax=Streptomyces stramineus TaxID=173861 RepID=A0ABP3K7G7_9ACTN
MERGRTAARPPTILAPALPAASRLPRSARITARARNGVPDTAVSG